MKNIIWAFLTLIVGISVIFTHGEVINAIPEEWLEIGTRETAVHCLFAVVYLALILILSHHITKIIEEMTCTNPKCNYPQEPCQRGHISPELNCNRADMPTKESTPHRVIRIEHTEPVFVLTEHQLEAAFREYKAKGGRIKWILDIAGIFPIFANKGKNG